MDKVVKKIKGDKVLARDLVVDNAEPVPYVNSQDVVDGVHIARNIPGGLLSDGEIKKLCMVFLMYHSVPINGYGPKPI